MRVAALAVVVLAIVVAGWVGYRATQPAKHCTTTQQSDFYGGTTSRTCR